MALTTLDFTTGLDFTGLVSATGADHNTLIESAEPKDDGSTEGKGLVIRTRDTALNTPNVPDATATLKWKRYLWIRLPHASALEQGYKFYVWDDNNESLETYLKWKTITVDLLSIENSITDLYAKYNSAETNLEPITNIAVAASETAANALTTAQAAQENVSAVGAIAANAQTVANEAKVKAVNAETQANNALAASSGKRLVKDALIPGTAGQMLRVKSDGSEVEWFNVKDAYFKASNSVQQTMTGDKWNLISLNTEEFDTGNLGTIAEGKVTLIAGTYFVRITIPCYNLGDAQAFLGNNSTKQIIISSTSGSDPTLLEISGIVTLAANTTIDIYIHPDAGGKLSQGSGAVSVAAETEGLPAGYAAKGVEGKFTTFEAWKIG